jgi:NAD(P)-dependent dehydrogenase (short-subunit alcohol dehydrogenase family)
LGGAGHTVLVMPTAIVTGASRGLGLAFARALAERHWRLVIDAREAAPLHAAAEELGAIAIPGDVADAASEPYEGWGGYGSSKAALEQLSAILAIEHPELRVYAVDPGDMNTRMHQEAFPGEDISDRPPPEDSVPGLLALIDGDVPSGRHRAHDLTAAA